MPIGQQILLRVPSLLLGLVMIGAAVILSVAGMLLVRRFVPHHKMKVHHDVTGPIFGTLGVIYAVILAFVVVIVWQNFDKANSSVREEATCLSDLYRDSEAFPLALKQAIKVILKEYADAVIHDEWKAMARGKSSPRAGQMYKKLCSLYIDYMPRTEAERVFFEESVRHLNQLGELRALRLMESRTGIHPLLWLVLVFGGIVTVTFTFLFGAENLAAQAVMAVLLAITIALILFTILLLDFPFTGGISVSPEPLKLIGVI